MHPYVRFASVVASAARRPRVGPFDASRITMRVQPQDVEVQRMNNGRYLTLMDLGRFDLAVRVGVGPALLKNRWVPLVRSATISFFKSLRIGQRYDLVTRIAGYDEKWWVIEQRFERGGEPYAVAYVKGLFRGPKGNVAPATLIAAGGHRDLEPPPMSEALRLWLASEEAIISENRRSEAARTRP